MTDPPLPPIDTVTPYFGTGIAPIATSQTRAKAATESNTDTNEEASTLSRRRGTSDSSPRHKFAWQSATARQLLAQIERVAAVDSTLLLLGESGTGKTTIARMVHERSARRDRPFVAVNCASLPAELIDAELFGHSRGAFTGAVSDRVGRVEAAAGGTLFLDEIGDLPLELQPKLLTFLQDRTFYRLGSNELVSADVRVISATHADLMERSQAGLFRRDLFFRLAVLGITAPPLAKRRIEIGTMARNILERIDRQTGAGARLLSADALKKLESHDWPGNIRELENVLESAAIFCESDTLRASDIALSCKDTRLSSPEVAEDFLSGKTLAELECAAIIATLEQCGGNKTQTARMLGISLRSIYNKMQKHGLVVKKSLNTES